eukprot:FR744231.1.p1 GENE.FR744231.1~~FR744231.1.p1  ORF type:complete len:310 (+),score=10.85 FR744231.1:108-932(+)
MAYLPLTSGILGGPLWSSLLSFLDVEIRPPVDTPILGQSVRLPCVDRILNWKELVLLSPQFHVSTDVALCCMDVGETWVGRAGFQEGRKQVDALFRYTSVEEDEPVSCRNRIANLNTLSWLFRRHFKFPIQTNGLAVVVSPNVVPIEGSSNRTSSDTLLASLRLTPFAPEAIWLHLCLKWKVATYRTMNEAVGALHEVLDVPVNLIMLDTSDTNTLRSGAAPVGPRAPVQVVWAKPLAGTIGALSLQQMLSLWNGTPEFDAYVLTGQGARPTRR